MIIVINMLFHFDWSAEKAHLDHFAGSRGFGSIRVRCKMAIKLEDISFGASV